MPRLLLLPALAACALAAEPAATPAIASAAAELTDHHAVEVLPGTVRAATAAVLMARVSGTIARIEATPGTAVPAGAALVHIDAQEIAAKRDQAKAAAAQAAADFQRISRLAASGQSSQAEFDAAQARAAGSAAAAAEAEVMVGYTRITAPFAGVVVRRHAEVGDLLSPGRPVIELEDPASLRLEVEVPESLAARLAVGTRLRVQVAAAAIDAASPVVEIVPAADPVSRTVLVKIALPAGTAGLRSGQFGRATLTVADGQVLTVPDAAILRRGQLDAVMVLDQGAARLRLVRLGGSDGGRTAIRAGLSAGELVALEPGSLRDGQPVKR